MTIKIGVVGAGSWGTALALQLARNKHQVYLWGHNPDKIQEMAEKKCNPWCFSEFSFPQTLIPTTDLTLLSSVNWLLLAIPSHALREFLIQFQPYYQNQIVVIATKGLEQGTGYLLYQVIEETLVQDKNNIAVLSGPSFAYEVAKSLPTAITLASFSIDNIKPIASQLHSKAFRVYTSNDIIGVSIGGALKNVLAIAAGISDGLGFGANSRAALLTRGLAEIMRLGLVIGGKEATFGGLAGLGDLLLTATDNQSRNRRLGLALAKGLTLEQALEEIGQAVEGVKTAQVAVKIAKQYQVEVPIITQVYRIIFEKIDIQQAVESLLMREQKAEI